MNKALSLLTVVALFFGAAIHAQWPARHSTIRVGKEKEPFHFMDVIDAQSVSSPDFDVHFYRCEWELDPAVRFIKGKVSAHFTITTPTASIIFDLTNALTVDSILYHDTKLNFQQTASNALEIDFPAALAQGRKDSLAIYYKGVPPNSGFGSFITTTHNGTPVLWTLSEPYGARGWWPCKDVLTDKADSIDIIITYPALYQSSSNGLPIREERTGDKKRDYWKHRYPIAAYLVAVAITNYSIDSDIVQLPSGNMPVSMYAYPESADAFKAATATAKASLQKFSALLGEYPFSRERYAQTQFGWGGGMEHQTNSFITVPGEILVAHELAHQWFGDKVTTGSWQDLWLNEGFATYMELVYVASVKQSDPAALLQNWKINITSRPDGSVFIPDTGNINRLFDSRLTYQKGGYVLHMLRWKLGDSAFFRGLRQYLGDPALRYNTARTADLQRNMEQISGQSLTEFFNDWIYGEGFPTYQGEWSSIRANNLHVELSQTTSHPSVAFFEMPVPLQFKSATRDTIITVNHTRNGEVFTINPGFMPDTMIIDPQHWILARDNRTLKTATVPGFTDVLIYPNPAINNATIYLPPAPTQQTSIRLYNVLGQEVFAKTILSGGNEEIRISLGQVTAGIYWVQVARGDGSKTVKPLLVVKR